jgi:hypothetical protein
MCVCLCARVCACVRAPSTLPEACPSGCAIHRQQVYLSRAGGASVVLATLLTHYEHTAVLATVCGILHQWVASSKQHFVPEADAVAHVLQIIRSHAWDHQRGQNPDNPLYCHAMASKGDCSSSVLSHIFVLFCTTCDVKWSFSIAMINIEPSGSFETSGLAMGHVLTLFPLHSGCERIHAAIIIRLNHPGLNPAPADVGRTLDMYWKAYHKYPDFFRQHKIYALLDVCRVGRSGG